MFISKIKISNFRGLNLELSSLKEALLIIGKNDTGKSNLCYAIRKVLDYDIRRIPFERSDSTNCNCEDIDIEIILDVKEVKNLNKSNIIKYKNYDAEELRICLHATYIEETMHYDEELVMGEDDPITFATNRFTPLDRVIRIAYIEPSYNFEKSEKAFFKFRQQKFVDEKENININISEKVANLNDTINSDENIKNITSALNSLDDFKSIFEGVEFGVVSDFDIANIYKSLKVVPMIDGDQRVNIGDGKNKTVSMLLQILTFEDDKDIILIVEEPENHLYPRLQKLYTQVIDKFNVSQIIYTTHSPYIVDFKKLKQIIRLSSKKSDDGYIENYSADLITKKLYDDYGFVLNEDFAQMLYYDTVLLVEGYSEKYFYNILEVNDQNFESYLSEKNMGIFCVGGIDFAPAKSMLESLGTKVFIKTDNDVMKTRAKDHHRIYGGIRRCFDCLSKESKNQLSELLGVENISKDYFTCEENNLNDNVENNMDEIVRIYDENNILLSVHEDGFERDLVEFMGVEAQEQASIINVLKEAKLKNLHEFIKENLNKICINKNNVDNPLVRFILK